MSKHSSMREEVPKGEASNNNQSVKQQNIVSIKKSIHNSHNPEKEWIATYIDGQYFLADPDAMNKLKIIQAELQEEKTKLAQLQHQNIDGNNSFLSLQQEKAQRQSNRSVCNTQFHPVKHMSNQEKVKLQLEDEQEKYIQKIKNMEKERVELKKNMKLVEEKQKTKKNENNEVQRSNKKSVKVQEGKEKSYHKSKLQKSIKESSNMPQILTPNILEVEPRSTRQKAPSQKPISIKKSQKPSQHNQLQVIQPVDNKQLTQRSIKKQISVRQESQVRQKSMKLESQRQKSMRQQSQVQRSMKQQGPIQKSIKQQSEIKAISESNKIEVHVIEAPSKSSRLIDATSRKNSNKAKESSEINNKIEQPSKKSSKIKDHQQIQLEHQENLEVKSRHSKIAEEDNKSKKPNKSVLDEQIKSNKSKINELLEIRDKKSQRSNLEVKQKSEREDKDEIKSKKSQVSKNNDVKSNNKSIHQEISIKNDPSIIQKNERSVNVQSSDHKQQLKSKISSAMTKLKAISMLNDQKSHKSSKLEEEVNADDERSNHIMVEQNHSQRNSHYQKSHKTNSKYQEQRSSHQPFEKSFIKEESFKKQPSIKQKSVSSYQKSENKEQTEKLQLVINQLATNPQKQEQSQKSRHYQQLQPQKLQKQKSRSGKSRNSLVNNNKMAEIKMKDSEKKDQSVQYSRVTEQKSQKDHINSIKFKENSESQYNFANNQSSYIKESSHYEQEVMTQHLPPHENEKEPQMNMKKNKQDSPTHQNNDKASNMDRSQKKSKTFIIHSRHGSVKDKNQKNYDKLNNSKYSSKKSKHSDFDNHFADDISVTKNEIAKLNQQIMLLQQKLQKVQEKQDQMQRLESSISKIPNKQADSHENQVRPTSPDIVELNMPENSFRNKAPPKLQIESSIINVNTNQDKRKQLQKQQEINEKSRLKIEIDRLRKIIRDMQIEKIKSIDHENELGESGLKKINSKHMDNEGRQLRNVQKQSLNSLDNSPLTQRRFYGSGARNRGEEFGKIIKNTSHIEIIDKKVQTPRKRSSFKLPYHVNEDEVVNDELLNESNKRSTQKNKFYSEVRRGDLSDRLQNKDRDSHHFIESSRIIAEEGYKGDNADNNNQNSNHAFTNFSKLSVQNNNSNPFNKVNFSRMVEYMKKTNPEEQQILPEIHLRDIKAPNLPNSPHVDMTQEELLELAKITYRVFGINIDEEDRQLCVKKYKNCVIFTINNSPSECILWHFSGKFYMGGWKSGQPGQGQKNGEGIEIIPEKHVYRGQFLNGKKNGTGILKLINGNIYDGQWIQGIKNGRGVYLDAATKVLYSGEWKDGKKDGQGYLKLSEMQFYYGTFVKSVKQGFGVEVFVNGDKYKGEYKNGKFHGKGKYIWSNESCYEGQFNQGVRQGQGSWKSAKNNADIYIGTYLNDKKNGYGRYVWANGCIYEGGFVNDVKHGKGRLTYQDGKEIKGSWQQGNLISTDEEKKVVNHEEQPLRRSLKVSTFGFPTSVHKSVRNQ